MQKQLMTDLIERALQLQQGEHIQIKCQNISELESCRAALNKARSRLREINPAFDKILISRTGSKKGNIFLLTLSKREEASNIILFRADGTQVPLKTTCQEEEETRELDRICKLMEEDGASEEEIEAFRRNGKED